MGAGVPQGRRDLSLMIIPACMIFIVCLVVRTISANIYRTDQGGLGPRRCRWTGKRLRSVPFAAEKAKAALSAA
jgi:hypothetical protein